jgi:hypothetical protein
VRIFKLIAESSLAIEYLRRLGGYVKNFLHHKRHKAENIVLVFVIHSFCIGHKELSNLSVKVHIGNSSLHPGVEQVPYGQISLLLVVEFF